MCSGFAPSMILFTMNTLILGLGNIIRGDDAAGIVCVERLREKYNNSRKNITFSSLHTAGISLVDALENYDRAIIVDAVITNDGKAGEVFWAGIENLPDPRSDRSYHDIHIADAVSIGRKMKMKMPSLIIILAIEVKDYQSWTEKISAEAEAGINRAVEEIELFLR